VPLPMQLKLGGEKENAQKQEALKPVSLMKRDLN